MRGVEVRVNVIGAGSFALRYCPDSQRLQGA